MMPESFKDHPLSIGEIKAYKSDEAADWSPRDALIACLRAIDSGALEPTALVICAQEAGRGRVGGDPQFFFACSDPYTILGLLEVAKFEIMDQRA